MQNTVRARCTIGARERVSSEQEDRPDSSPSLPLSSVRGLQTQEPCRHAPKTSTTTTQATVVSETVVKEHLYMTWMLLNLLRHILWPRSWSSMVDFPCALEKDGNSPIVGCVSIRSNWGLCCSKSLLFLLIFISICSTSY